VSLLLGLAPDEHFARVGGDRDARTLAVLDDRALLAAGVEHVEADRADLGGALVAADLLLFARDGVRPGRNQGVRNSRAASQDSDQAHQKAADFIPHRQPSLLSVTEGHKLNGGAA
jgi:hypothetical protein